MVPVPATSSPAHAWSAYVRRVIGDDRQADAAARTGVDQTTISRWLNPRPGAVGSLRIHPVVAFARGYEQPVLEALLAAGLLEPGDIEDRGQLVPDLRAVPDVELAAELHRRLKQD